MVPVEELFEREKGRESHHHPEGGLGRGKPLVGGRRKHVEEGAAE
jgi:hypothetical protein